jgi:hypothetical protein
MEILVVVIAELVTLLVPLILALAEAAVLAISLLFDLVALVIEICVAGSIEAAKAARRARQEAKPAEPPAGSPPFSQRFYRAITSPVVTRWKRRITLAAGAILAVTIVAALLLSTVFFDWFVRYALRAAEQRNGIAVSFEEADGNLFEGRINLHQARFVRQGNPVSDFDLTADRFLVDFDIGKLIFRKVAFEEVVVEGVRGKFTRTGKRDPAKPRREFEINQFSIADVQIAVADASIPARNVEVPLAVTSLTVDSFQSRWTAFDVLFRSTCQGTLGGQPFEISSRKAGELQETIWRGRDLPIHAVGQYFTGPLSWLVDGRIDIEVITSWRPAEPDPELKMHCQFVAHDFAAAVPPDLKLIERAVIEPAVAMLNANRRKLPLEFDLTMRRSDFAGQITLFAAGLREAIGNAASLRLKQIIPRAGEKLDDTLDRVRDRVRGLLRKDRGDAEATPQDEEKP